MTLVPPDIEGVSGGGARERIVRAAYDLFCRYGVAATGVERIIAEAGVHRTSLYNHFASKEHLALAVLERREEVWSRGWLARVASGGATPAEGLLALFDAFDEWFHRDDYEGCLLIGALLESGGRTTPVGVAAADALVAIRAFLQELAEALGAPDPAGLALQLQILLSGAIVQAATGARDAARRARPVAEAILAQASAR